MACGQGDETCGKHSGIPACCRAWFITVWNPLCRRALKDGINDDVSALVTSHRNKAQQPSGAHYILCPGCKQCKAYNYLLECPR